MLQRDSPPVLFAAVDQHHDLGIGRGQVGGFSKGDEIRADLSKGVRFSLDDQEQLNVR
ncbi:MAG TPA: hypothetical protein VEI07_16290 [Planctomycetaceae bacterium]|nr:hypothetical protein [Planctomycetaceae bacterium]